MPLLILYFMTFLEIYQISGVEQSSLGKGGIRSPVAYQMKEDIDSAVARTADASAHSHLFIPLLLLTFDP